MPQDREAILMSVTKKYYESSGEVERLVREFESCRLSPSEFSHPAHLTVALWYLSSGLTVMEATGRMRAGLFRFLYHHGVDRQKYNETITLFWIKLISGFLADANRVRSLAEIANEMIEAFGKSQLIFDYYSREHLFSEEARRGWVEPDLKPL
jgi:hypothetical protein